MTTDDKEQVHGEQWWGFAVREALANLDSESGWMRFRYYHMLTLESSG